MYGKSGQAVQVSSNNDVALAEGVPGATTFLLGDCRTSASIVPEALRPSCVSLMVANRSDWYVRHSHGNVVVDSEYATKTKLPNHLPNFEIDSSFILYSDTFYPKCYAFAAVNYRQSYITSSGDGSLVLNDLIDIAGPEETASFRVFDYNTSSKFYCFLSL